MRALPLLLLACGGPAEPLKPDVSNQPWSTWFADVDADGFGDAGAVLEAESAPPGFVDNNTDCDDTQATVHPGATETCDAIDQDCDGSIDEDAVDPATFYADTDGDGFGDPNNPTEACVAPVGSVTDSADCDDADAEVYPGAPEACDSRDQDCDGTLDNGVISEWYPDQDGDSFGDEGGLITGCTSPVGYVGVAGDCADDDPAIHPDAEDRCENGLDEDCLGGDLRCRPEGTSSVTDAEIIWRGAELGDLAGRAISCGGDADGDGSPEAIILQDESNRSWYGQENGEGTVWLISNFTPGERELSDEPVSIQGIDDHYQRLTGAMAAIGDLNGDGGDELLLGAWIVSAPIPSRVLDAPAWLKEQHGSDVTPDVANVAVSLGDRQFAVGNTGWDAQYESYDIGAVFVLEGMPSGQVELDLDAIATLAPDPSHEFGSFAWDLCAGDLDGDGTQDLTIGAAGRVATSTSGVIEAGLAYVVYGPFSGDLRMSEADGPLIDADAAIRAGTWDGHDVFGVGFDVACAGDVDGDGRADLLVSGNYRADPLSGPGLAFYFNGPLSGEHSTNDALGVVTGVEDYEGTGTYEAVGDSVSLDADLDSDGHADTVVTSAGVAGSGQVAIFYEQLEGTLLMADADMIINGEAPDDSAEEVAACPDLNGDGADDLLIGAVGNDYHDSWSGSAYLIAGGGW